MILRKRKYILATSVIFLFLFIFYKWQIATSNYYLEQGTATYNSENFDEALKNYKYAETIKGNKDIIYEAKIKRAQIFYNHWQLGQAEKELFEALHKKQTDYRAFELLGDIYFAKRELEKARDNYEQSLKLDNQINNNLNLKLAKCFVANQELDLALKTLLDLENKNSEVLYYLGLLDLDKNVSYNNYLKNLADDENYKNKIIKIKKVLEIYDAEKNSDYNAVLIADLYNKIGEPDFAISKVNKTIKNNPAYRDAWLVSGKSNFIIGDYQKSLADFKKALLLDSNNSEIHFWIAKLKISSPLL